MSADQISVVSLICGWTALHVNPHAHLLWKQRKLHSSLASWRLSEPSTGYGPPSTASVRLRMRLSLKKQKNFQFLCEVVLLMPYKALGGPGKPSGGWRRGFYPYLQFHLSEVLEQNTY